MLSTAAAIVLLVIVESVSSYLEGNVGEFQFTIPDANRNFNDAVSSCKKNYSTLSVVNDTYIQLALTQFLSSSSVTSMIYINVKLYQTSESTWFLLDASRYNGYVADQEPRQTNYLLYCHLRYNQSRFIVAASNPSDNRNYICVYDDTRCLNNSTSDIRYDGRCYVKYENESLTWFQSKGRCFNNGGDLATFQSNPNDRWAPELNTSWLNPSFTYWVGIRWSNWMFKLPDGGGEAIYTSWSTGKPKNYTYQCVCVDPQGTPPWSWTDCDCSAMRKFVCLKLVPTTTALTTTVTITTSTVIAVIATSTETNAIQSNSTTNAALAIGLGAGIGGGLFLILLIAIVIVAVTLTRRRRRKSDGVETRFKVENTGATTEPNAGPTAPAIPDIYAQISMTDHHPTNDKPKMEVIYAKPEFVTKQNITSSDSDPTTVRQGNVKSIMLGGPSDFSVSTTSLS